MRPNWKGKRCSERHEGEHLARREHFSGQCQTLSLAESEQAKTVSRSLIKALRPEKHPAEHYDHEHVQPAEQNRRTLKPALNKPHSLDGEKQAVPGAPDHERPA